MPLSGDCLSDQVLEHVAHGVYTIFAQSIYQCNCMKWKALDAKVHIIKQLLVKAH